MQQCPRCKKELMKRDEVYTCPDFDGILLPIEGLKERTSRNFSKWFWTKVIQIKGPRSIPCPACRTRMVQLNIEAKRVVELDCCPGCFALWLDGGEERVLRGLFMRRATLEGERPVPSDEMQDLARSLVEHRKSIERYKMIAKLGEFLSYQIHPFYQHRIRLLLGWSWWW